MKPMIERAGHRDQHRPKSQMIAGGRNQGRVQTAEVEQVGEQADEPQQGPRHPRSDDADGNRQRADRDHAGGGREVAQCGALRLAFHAAASGSS